MQIRHVGCGGHVRCSGSRLSAAGRPVPDFHNRLAIRLATLLTLALAPFGSVAIYSEYESWTAEREAADMALYARTIDAVSGPHALLESAMAAARRLGMELAARDVDAAACSDDLGEYVAASGLFGFAGFVEASGLMSCSSTGDVVDVSDHDGFAASFADPSPTFTFQPGGTVTQRPAVLANWPVFDGDTLQGFMSVSISTDRLDMISTTQDSGQNDKITVLLNHRGEPLIRRDPAEAHGLLPSPEVIQHLLRSSPGNLRAVGQSGETRIFTMATLSPGRLFVLGAWDPEQMPSVDGPPFWRLAFPVLMWVASIVVVMLAIHYLVVRHLRHINRQLRSFALGHRDTFQRLPGDAPRELREIDSTFTKMALLIRRDEGEREGALREKTTLLKEVHHRVKNNLQLIASILNLQGRRVSDPAARDILNGVQGRVRSLATIHRILYEQKLVSETDATTFFETILNETLALAKPEAQDMTVDARLDPVAISPDKIIPAALLFAEALTNALKHIAPAKASEPALLQVTLSNHDGHVELSVRNSLSGTEHPGPSEGLGQELMTAFALQIHGDLEMGPVEGALGPGWETRLRLSLPRGGDDADHARIPGRVL